VLAALVDADPVGQHHSGDVAVILEQIARGDVAEHRFGVECLVARQQLRLRIEIQADLLAAGGEAAEPHRPPVEHAIFGWGAGLRVSRGQDDGDRIPAQRHGG
jgi:hypothetical protein